MKKSRSRSRFFAWLFASLSFVLALALAGTVLVIVKLNRNNLFSKSILLDNNYFMDYSAYEYKPETDNSAGDTADDAEAEYEANVYVDGGMFMRQGITYDENGNATIFSTAVDVESYIYIDNIMLQISMIAPVLTDDITISSKIENDLYGIYGIWGLSADGDREAEIYLRQYGIDISIGDSSGENVQIDIPYISQEGDYPNGCEAVSGTMLLNFYGFDIDPGTFIDDYLNCEPTYIRWGCRYGPNPKLAYAGDPRDEDGGFGCFAPVIVKALNEYLSDGYYAKNTTGLSLNTLKSRYIDRGIPVAVWVTVGMEEVDRMLQWQSEDRSETYLYPANEHCMVLVGYDEDSYIFADPYNSNGVVEYPIEDSVLAYNSLGMQSVVILDGTYGLGE